MKTGAGKICLDCELRGETRKATQSYIGGGGELTHACDKHYAQAMELLAQLRDTSEGRDSYGGWTFDPVQDLERMGKQYYAVMCLVVDGQWRSLRQISDATGAPEASVSARLRDIRKDYGAAAMEAKRAQEGKGTWLYRCHVRAKVAA